jgi:hypothetical protein
MLEQVTAFANTVGQQGVIVGGAAAAAHMLFAANVTSIALTVFAVSTSTALIGHIYNNVVQEDQSLKELIWSRLPQLVDVLSCLADPLAEDITLTDATFGYTIAAACVAGLAGIYFGMVPAAQFIALLPFGLTALGITGGTVLPALEGIVYRVREGLGATDEFEAYE